MDFVPFVLEAHGGGIASAARRMMAFVASAAATLEGGEVPERAARLAGSLSTALMRESARAIVRRLSSIQGSSTSACPQGWEAADFTI